MNVDEVRLLLAAGLSSGIRVFIKEFVPFAPVHVDFNFITVLFCSLVGLAIGALSYLWVRCLYLFEIRLTG